MSIFGITTTHLTEFKDLELDSPSSFIMKDQNYSDIFKVNQTSFVTSLPTTIGSDVIINGNFDESGPFFPDGKDLPRFSIMMILDERIIFICFFSPRRT